MYGRAMLGIKSADQPIHFIAICMYTLTKICTDFLMCHFFFQTEDGIRVAQESRGLGDVYKRQISASSEGRRLPA